MSTASALLFAAVPIIAALSLNMDTFVPFFILFCVSAGLTISSNERQNRTGSDASLHGNNAGSKTGSRSPNRPQAAGFARF